MDRAVRKAYLAWPHILWMGLALLSIGCSKQTESSSALARPQRATAERGVASVVRFQATIAPTPSAMPSFPQLEEPIPSSGSPEGRPTGAATIAARPNGQPDARWASYSADDQTTGTLVLQGPELTGTPSTAQGPDNPDPSPLGSGHGTDGINHVASTRRAALSRLPPIIGTLRRLPAVGPNSADSLRRLPAVEPTGEENRNLPPVDDMLPTFPDRSAVWPLEPNAMHDARVDNGGEQLSAELTLESPVEPGFDQVANYGDAATGVDQMADRARRPQWGPRELPPAALQTSQQSLPEPAEPPTAPPLTARENTVVVRPIPPPHVPHRESPIRAHSDRRTMSRQIDARMHHAEGLAARGALFAARAEVVRALRAVTQMFDTEQAGRGHSEALAKAFRAMDEAADFMPAGSGMEAELDLDSLVQGHHTPVLKDENLQSVTPLLAQQRYFGFAQQQLVEACEHFPAGSRALYGLGRLHMEMERVGCEMMALNLPRAMTLYQAALVVDSRNALAANELGVLLAKCGRLQDARSVLLHGIEVGGAPELWKNVAVVNQRLGEFQLAEQARRQWHVASERQRSQTKPGQSSRVRWVSAEQFSSAAPSL